MSAYETLSALVAAKAETLGVSLTLGYIGNMSLNVPETHPHFYDDRLWMIWIDGVQVVATENTAVALRGRNLDEMIREVENGAIEMRLLSVAQGGGRFRVRDILTWDLKVEKTAAEVAASIANAQAGLLGRVS